MIHAQAARWELRERHVHDRQLVDRAEAVEAAALLHVADHADDFTRLIGDAHTLPGVASAYTMGKYAKTTFRA